MHIPFRPALLGALRGYNRARFVKDVGAGLTVGVVALPLAMAFAIASGLKPEAGLFTAIVGGLLISLLGGSKVQIGGPAGAFIVIVYGIVDQYGVPQLLLATALSGLMLMLMGLLRLGTLVRFIPVVVIIGFTNGIAVIVALSQIKDVLGLSTAKMPADFLGMLAALWAALPSWNPMALGLALGSLLVLVLWQYAMPKLQSGIAFRGALTPIPGSIIALVLATFLTWSLDLPVETIGSRFGGIPSGLPDIVWPALSWADAQVLLRPAFTLALLGAIESLLCARVADGMTGDRHDSNQELLAQGMANCLTPLVAGMPVTGTIARTATSIKSGASSPVAGIVHALTLLLVVLLAAPLAAEIPLAALAAILLFVAWNMGEWREFARLRQFRLPYRLTLLSVFVLTVVVDLTVAVEVGLAAACLTFIYRISSLTRAERLPATPPGVEVWRLYGALFFGAIELIEEREAQLPERALVLDFKNLIYLDSSGLDALLSLTRACERQGVQLIVSGLVHQPLDMAQRMNWPSSTAATLAADWSEALDLVRTA